jgi:hypothetical protein
MNRSFFFTSYDCLGKRKKDRKKKDRSEISKIPRKKKIEEEEGWKKKKKEERKKSGIYIT